MSKSFRLFLVISIVVTIVLFFKMKNKNDTETKPIVSEIPIIELIPETPIIELVETPIMIVSNSEDEDFVPENLPKITEDFPEVVVIPEIPDPVKVSQILISKTSSTDTALSIADVRLFNNGVQVSLGGGKATQSATSTYQNKAIYGPEKAIDGANLFRLSGESVTFTELGKTHWWKLLFRNHVDATEIKIYNNKDGLEMLKGSILKVFDGNSNVILQKTLSRNAIQTHSLI